MAKLLLTGSMVKKIRGRAGTVRELFDRTQLNELNGRRVYSWRIWN